MKLSCHSEVGLIKTLYLKDVPSAFVNHDHINNYWENLNYFSAPDFERAKKEYLNFESILLEHGINISKLDQNNRVNMDSIYCRDAAIATDAGMIICNMGKEARKNEPSAEKEAFEKVGIKVLGIITSPGTLEGGDVAWLNEQTLAVGHTYRSNLEGIEQLTAMLEPLGVNVITVPLPHYKGPSDVFHLMSILSPVDTNLAVVYSPLMPIGFRNLLLNMGYELIEVPDTEFDSMACNVLAIAPRVCMMVAGNPITQKALEKAGCKVIVYEGTEISVKGGGGPTCLTRPIYREL
jgi:N-dimethylarginine dimethylaminohydrolase